MSKFESATKFNWDKKENNSEIYLLAVVPVLLYPSKSAPELGEIGDRESARSGCEVGKGLLEDSRAPRKVRVLSQHCTHLLERERFGSALDLSILVPVPALHADGAQAFVRKVALGVDYR